MTVSRNPIAIAGVGRTQLSRARTTDASDIVLDACRAAIEDAMLDPDEVDGIAIRTGGVRPYPDVGGAARRLGITPAYWENAGKRDITGLIAAVEAIDAGVADRILVCKVMTRAPADGTSHSDAARGVGVASAFQLPYGASNEIQIYGLMKRRWMHRHGITHEQIGSLCVTQRAHATVNPYAIARTPLSLEEYLTSPWVAQPMHILDCDYPVTGAVAYIVASERNVSRRAGLARLRGWTSTGRDSMIGLDHYLPERGDAPNPRISKLYREAGLDARHIGLWLLYDGFSHWAMEWMEEVGMTSRGGSGELVAGRKHISFDGEYPVNTHGGSLSEGRLHGGGHIFEALQQLRGAAGDRQVADLEHVLVTTGYPTSIGYAMVLAAQ